MTIMRRRRERGGWQPSYKLPPEQKTEEESDRATERGKERRKGGIMRARERDDGRTDGRTDEQTMEQKIEACGFVRRRRQIKRDGGGGVATQSSQSVGL